MNLESDLKVRFHLGGSKQFSTRIHTRGFLEHHSNSNLYLEKYLFFVYKYLLFYSHFMECELCVPVKNYNDPLKCQLCCPSLTYNCDGTTASRTRLSLQIPWGPLNGAYAHFLECQSICKVSSHWISSTPYLT